MEPWLANYGSNTAAQAILDKLPSIDFRHFGGLTNTEETTLEYYVNLLAMRKRVFEWAAFGFQKEHGRSPTPQEMIALKESIWYKLGHSPEEIARRYGHLTEAQVYGALAYHHANRDEIEAEIAADDANADRIEREGVQEKQSA